MMRLVRVFIGLLLFAACVGVAQADTWPGSQTTTVTSQVRQAWAGTQFKIGIGNQWAADQHENFSNSSPKPVAFARPEIGLPWARLGLEGEVGRRIDTSKAGWNLRAAVTFRFK